LAYTVGYNDILTLENKALFKDAVVLHYVVHSRKPQLDAMKDGLRSLGVLPFLSKFPYLHSEAFPKQSQRVYSPQELLHVIEFIGEDRDRIEQGIRTYIESLGIKNYYSLCTGHIHLETYLLVKHWCISDSVTIIEFIKCATGWPQLPTDPIKVKIGDYDRFYVQACSNTILIPSEMDEDLVLQSIRQVVAIGGFGGV
jgi:hypothetical protein